MRTLAKTNQQEVNEKKLFHGTSPDYVEAICKQNFDWRLHGKNATKYGEGSYFAVNASYSHSYAKRDGNMSQFMFLATVLAGSYTEGNSSYRRPPQKQPANPASDLYDSCVDNKLNPTIFVVFDTDQFYPEYIIKYSSAQPNPKAPTPRRATPRAKPLSSQTTRNRGILKQKPTNSNSLGTASRPRGSAVDSGYSAATVPSLGITSVNASRSSSNVGAVTNTNGSAARGGHSTVSQATSTDYISPQSRRITRLTPPASPTYPRGILKQHSTRSSGLGTASSPVAISGYPTVSQTTSTNYVSPQPRPTTTLTPPASQTYPRGILKQHPTSSRGSGRASSPVATSWYPTVSQTTPRPIPVPRPSTSQMNHQWIPKQQPTTTDNPHGTGASSSNSTPTVSNSGLTSTRQTERSQNLNTVSNTIDSTVRSDYSTRNDSSSWLTGGNLTRNSCNFGEAVSPNEAASAARDDVPSNVFSSRPSTSHAYHATPSSSFSSSSHQGSQKKKKDCMIM